jgi:sugar phosphate isomerase/epimerase
MNDVEITMLTSMADKNDFRRALDRFMDWKLRVLDIKDHVWGKSLIDLSDEEADRAVHEVRQRDLKTYCLSSMLFHDPVERGEAHFRDQLDTTLLRIVQLARLFQPVYIRLLTVSLEKRSEVGNSVTYIREMHPWLIDCYREAIDRICAAGFRATIENEAKSNMISTVQEAVDFFDLLDLSKVTFTWDIQNLWAMGTFPDLAVFERLKPLIGYVHFKGGQVRKDSGSTELHWRAPLEEASWPVKEVCAAVLDERCSPVLCLNRSHGQARENYDRDLEVLKDLAFLKSIVAGTS